MADEPENHTLRLLREMREENQRLHAETRADMEQRFESTREENLRLHAETREQLATVLETVVEMAKTANTTAEAVAELNGRVETIEGRLNIVDSRLARIEKHLGFVKA